MCLFSETNLHAVTRSVRSIGLCSVVVLGLVFLSGCAQARAPEFMIMGSYFPSWLVGAAVAIPLTLLLRTALIRLGLDDLLPVRLLVYVCIGLMFTLAFAYFFSPR